MDWLSSPRAEKDKRLGIQTAFDFYSPKISGGFYTLPQQASLSRNAQWRSQSANVLWRIKPCAELCNLFVGNNTRSGFKTSD
jgi:hypothetical protein